MDAILQAVPTFAEVTGFFGSLDITTVWAICFGVLILCGFGLPIPEDITLVLCGYMTYVLIPADGSQGDPRLYAAAGVAIGMAGVLIGDGIMFTLGQKLGVPLMARWPFRSLLGDGRAEKAQAFLQAHGPKVLFSARFMPGLRSVVFFTSGTLGIRLRTFLFYDGLAAALSVPALVLSSWYWGEQIEAVVAKARTAEHGILAVIVAVVVIFGVKYWWGQRKKRKELAAAVAVGE